MSSKISKQGTHKKLLRVTQAILGATPKQLPGKWAGYHRVVKRQPHIGIRANEHVPLYVVDQRPKSKRYDDSGVPGSLRRKHEKELAVFKSSLIEIFGDREKG